MPDRRVVPLKNLVTENLPSLGSETSSSVAKERSSDEGPLKSRGLRSISSSSPTDHPSTSDGTFSLNVMSSANSVHTVPSSSKTAISALRYGNGLKTSTWKVIQLFRASKLSKHYHLGFGSVVSGKNKMLFLYDLFTKLYN